MPTILIIDDDTELLDNVNQLLTEEGFEVIMASTGADGVALARARSPDIIVCDVGMPAMDGYSVLGAIRSHAPTRGTPFIFLTARADREGLRAGMNLGADDYVTKPFIMGELLEAVRARLRRTSEITSRLGAALEEPAGASAPSAAAALGTLVQAPEMLALYAQIEHVAASQLSVLVLGETGVGKEVVARELHRRSPRAAGPFLPLNCAALSEQLLEAELFGYERGSFTGATRARPGLIETAQGGTLFLDEIGELPAAVQVKLLRVLEERKLLRVGARAARDVDVRFIAATHRDLEREIAEQRFREDLFYRLNGASFSVPPLRQRRVEIAPLARLFLTRACVEQGRSQRIELSPAALAALLHHAWPGNVRELRNAIERAVALCQSDRIELEHLPQKIARGGSSSGAEPPGEPLTESLGDARARLERELTELERRRLLKVLEESGGNQATAAQRLGVSRRTLVYRLSALGLTRPRK
ncbi:MAG TPA: sigma-54 dependent transcriptional regulator [Polyangiaceae bacterium]|nr:sigma-54 dependent transcriptional regulator [Polyangiaceae bacterium]